MTELRAKEILNEVTDYLVEIEKPKGAIQILRNCGVTDKELVEEFWFSKEDVMDKEDE